MASNESARDTYRRSDWVWLFFKGLAMGAADVVPGVSGGTIAFISGIYPRLLAALKSLSPVSLYGFYRESASQKRARDGLRHFWRAVDGRFLTTLFAGIVLSILSLANVINYGLTHYPILVWSFFFGLVLASILYLLMQIDRWRGSTLIAIGLGMITAWVIVSLRPVQLPAEWWMLLLAGAIAICAMILPGISGSFILLLMGMYPVFIEALRSFNLLFLASFACGCLVGLLGFSHVLSWLLQRYATLMYALLTGFLIGSLTLLWPWKRVIETTVDRHGEIIPLVQVNVTPMFYAQFMAKPAYLWQAGVCVLFGIVLVLLLERIGSR